MGDTFLFVLRSRKRVCFIVAAGAELLDITGPWEVMQHANDVLGRTAYEVELFGPGGPELRTRHGLVIAGVQPLPSKVRRLPEVAVVAGGSPATPLPAAEARPGRWLPPHPRRIPTLGSICTRAFLPGEAGLLDGR